ncbi:laminin subunit beta-1-like [Iris pallida]|uniref:Laminin subunit beta-1-like n=1 Tax=Iris pallida TaxID=29817 RepID=A0AAX6DSV1_IRIPA|nr:laminin subunit beta-1-like [Iris pallida]
MAYKEVFRFLQEVFPQVDLRILKAVALEHPKDADAAAEFILSEILPSTRAPTEASYTVDDAEETRRLTGEDMPVGMQYIDISSQRQGAEDENASVLSGSLVACESDPFPNHPYAALISSPFMAGVGKESNDKADDSHLLSHHQEAGGSSFPSEIISVQNEVAAVADHKNAFAFQCNSDLINETIIELTSNEHVNDQQVSSEKSMLEVTSAEQFSPPSLGYEKNCCSTSSANDQELNEIEASGSVTIVSSNAQVFPSTHERSLDLEESALETDINGIDEYEVPLSRRSKRSADTQDFCGSEVTKSASTGTTSANDISSSIEEGMPNILEDGCSHKSSSSLIDAEGQLPMLQPENSSVEAVFESVESDIVLGSDEPTTVPAQSRHVIKVNLLEDLITDVKNNKKSVVSALGLTTKMIKEVERLEEKAKQAKEETSKAGQDILTKAEDIRGMHKHAKDANDMRAGEVYAEKAILATEARELQSRLLSLSDEREKYLSIIEEIRQKLEARLAVAEKELEEAEQEKLEKVAAACNILKEQEAIMEEIVQESKKVQQEAEENLKLREFLMDRGSAVDILQGEIAVICEDVLLLKEKVDGQVPFNRSLQSTICSLASSSSSASHIQSVMPETTPQLMEVEESQERTPGDLDKTLQLESLANDGYWKTTAGSTNKGSPDDDWELLINFSP